MSEDKIDDISCSFCGRGKEEVDRLVSGIDSSCICNHCITLCNEALEEEGNYTQDEEIMKLPTPDKLHKKLDEYVIGQHSAKKILSVAVYNHYKRVLYSSKSDIELEKSNILIVGPTGTGKTLLARTLAKLLNVPFAISDATTLTEAGYVGEDVENVVLKLVQNADYDIERAQKGIIFIDEIDKVAKKGDSPSITRDVSGEGVQQALLKIIEGTVASIPQQGGRKHPHQEYLQVDTTDILFICGGAFDGIDEVIKRRTGKKTLGFGTVAELDPDETPVVNVGTKRFDLLQQAEPDDFVKYGLIPEFVGRLPIAAPLEELDEEALVRILTEPKNSLIKQYEKMLSFDKVKLTFTQSALVAIAKLSVKRKTGARGLRAILESVMLDVMYKLPSMKDVKECIINKDVITGKAEAITLDKLSTEDGSESHDKFDNNDEISADEESVDELNLRRSS